MKYMTFNSSCSFAGLANLLSLHGIETEDREIALRMHLPYLFARRGDGYLSGPMLQGAEWFNLYLNPLGFTLAERILGKDAAVAELRTSAPAMLGLRVSPESKHAVICTGWQGGGYRFINNKREASPEPETFCLTEADLLARLDEPVVVGHLEQTEPRDADFRPFLEDSVETLRGLQKDIRDFCALEQSAASLRAAMNSLFRPILLDGVTMLELLEETEIAGPLKEVRAQLLAVIKQECPAVLENKLDTVRLNAAITQYEKRIVKHMETI